MAKYSSLALAALLLGSLSVDDVSAFAGLKTSGVASTSALKMVRKWHCGTSCVCVDVEGGEADEILFLRFPIV